jgi:hypothetical protein
MRNHSEGNAAAVGGLAGAAHKEGKSVSDLRCYICAEPVEEEHVRHAGDRRVYCSGHCLRMLGIVRPKPGANERLRPVSEREAAEAFEREAAHYAAATDSTLEYARAVLGELDAWVPACGGHEVPAVIGHVRVLYCWNAATGEHAYINLDTDLICDEHDLRSLGLSI